MSRSEYRSPPRPALLQIEPSVFAKLLASSPSNTAPAFGWPRRASSSRSRQRRNRRRRQRGRFDGEGPALRPPLCLQPELRVDLHVAPVRLLGRVVEAIVEAPDHGTQRRPQRPFTLAPQLEAVAIAESVPVQIHIGRNACAGRERLTLADQRLAQGP